MVMVWVAISPRGMPKPVFYRSGSPSVDSHIYIDKFLQKSLLPFIQEHHADSNYIFWPDLASAHYLGLVTATRVAVVWVGLYRANSFLSCLTLLSKQTKILFDLFE